MAKSQTLLAALLEWQEQALAAQPSLTQPEQGKLAGVLQDTATRFASERPLHGVHTWWALVARLQQSEAPSADDLAALIESLLVALLGLQELEAIPAPTHPEQGFYRAMIEEVLDQLVPLIFHLTGVAEKGWHEALRWHVMHEELTLLRQLGYPNTDPDAPVA